MAMQGEDTSKMLEGCPSDNSPAAADAASSPDQAMDEQLFNNLLNKKVGEMTGRELMAFLERLRQANQVPTTTPREDLRLLFDFNYINKKEIFAIIIPIIERQGFRNSNAQVIRFLAEYTNLGSVNSIHAQLYLYKDTVK